MLNCIVNNPFRILGVLSNSPLKERVANQNRLIAFSKVGKTCVFPNDFSTIISTPPSRTSESLAAATSAINLDKDRLKYSFFWFVIGSAIDSIAIKHLQAGNTDKAHELFDKKETFSSLINKGVLCLMQGKIDEGYSLISRVVHSDVYRDSFIHALGLGNIEISESAIYENIIDLLLSEIPAKDLLKASSNSVDKEIICRVALEEPISKINSAIAVANSVDSKDAQASLNAGTLLMKSTKGALQDIQGIAGKSSPHYQAIADSLAKQILQCGINYYNNAPDTDVESPRKAMVLQEYALKIAVGKLTKDRCRKNYDILKKAVDELPPAEVATEARLIKEELRKFYKLPDKICFSVTLISNTRQQLKQIKAKLGANNPFYLSLSTTVVNNALHNIIEEVNQEQSRFEAVLEALQKGNLNSSMLDYIGNDIYSKIKPVIRDAWDCIVLIDNFDMESEFRIKRYNPNRDSLKKMCTSLNIPTTPPRTSTPPTPSGPKLPPIESTSSTSNVSSNTSSTNNGWTAYWIVTLICAIIGAVGNGGEGFITGGLFGVIIAGNIARQIFKED